MAACWPAGGGKVRGEVFDLVEEIMFWADVEKLEEELMKLGEWEEGKVVGVVVVEWEVVIWEMVEELSGEDGDGGGLRG